VTYVNRGTAGPSPSLTGCLTGSQILWPDILRAFSASFFSFAFRRVASEAIFGFSFLFSWNDLRSMRRVPVFFSPRLVRARLAATGGEGGLCKFSDVVSSDGERISEFAFFREGNFRGSGSYLFSHFIDRLRVGRGSWVWLCFFYSPLLACPGRCKPTHANICNNDFVGGSNFSLLSRKNK